MDGKVVIETMLDTTSFEAQIDYVTQRMEEIEYKLKQADMGLEVGDVTKLEAEYEKLSNTLSKLVTKQKQLGESHNFDGLKSAVSSVGKSMEDTVKKVARWGLALFGIRSIYLGLRQAMSTISQYNDDMANKIESIKYSLAMALEPIITRIVNLVYKMVQYLGYIIKAWTGKDIFANAQKNLGKANKSAKELKKTMAGFDTANVLSDTSTTGGDAGKSGVSAISQLSEGNVPKWLLWIAENGPFVISTLSGIAAGLVAVKLGANGIQGLGIGITIGGIVYSVMSLLRYLKDPTWKKFGGIIQGIGAAVLGLGLVFGGLPAIITGVVILALGTLARFWDKVGEGFLKLKDKLFGWAEGLSDKGFVIISFLLDVASGVVEAIYHILNGLFTGVRNILDGIISMFRGDFKNGMILIGKGIANAIIGIINGAISLVAGVWNGILDGIHAIGKWFGKDWNVGKAKLNYRIPYLATGGIVSMPGRGVPVGGAMAGEKGREGVLPLTNSQAMSQLGQEIGKWINVNVDLTTKLDSRVLSRSLEKVQNNKSFIRNGV